MTQQYVDALMAEQNVCGNGSTQAHASEQEYTFELYDDPNAGPCSSVIPLT